MQALRVYYPARMRRGLVIGLSVRPSIDYVGHGPSVMISLSVCYHHENRQISTSRHLSNS